MKPAAYTLTVLEERRLRAQVLRAVKDYGNKKGGTVFWARQKFEAWAKVAGELEAANAVD